MKIWSISFILMFGSIELYQWLRAMQIPLPVYISLGVLLAIASNAKKMNHSLFKSSPHSSHANSSSPASVSPSVSEMIPKPPVSLSSVSQSQGSISFKIKPIDKMSEE